MEHLATRGFYPSLAVRNAREPADTPALDLFWADSRFRSGIGGVVRHERAIVFPRAVCCRIVVLLILDWEKVRPTLSCNV